MFIFKSAQSPFEGAVDHATFRQLFCNAFVWHDEVSVINIAHHKSTRKNEKNTITLMRRNLDDDLIR